MTRRPTFSPPQLPAFRDIMVDTDTGLSGSEIGQLLSACQVDDPGPIRAKRRALRVNYPVALNIKQVS